MYWVGLTLLALGAALLGLTNPWQFFKAIYGSFFDWTEAFWYLQWGGFWLVTASLLVFGGLAWKTPDAFAARWKTVPAGIAVGGVVLFFVFSMPEKSNQRDWQNGWLGARVYARTKIWRRADNRGDAALPDRMKGHWEAPGGFRFTVSRDSIRMTSLYGETEWSARTCRYRYRVDYDYTFRQALDRPIPDGLAFTSFDQTGPPAPIPLADRRFPRLTCSCDEKMTTLVLVDIDRLLAFTESEPVLLARLTRHLRSE